MLSPKILLLICFLGLVSITRCKKATGDEKPDWAKKDIRDYSDADLERLYEQWEEDEEPLPPDELPEYMRPPPAQSGGFDINKISSMKPDDIMKMTKKGKTVMMFINLEGSPTRQDCETLTSLWQSGLRNNHIQAERYVVEDNRAIFVFSDGAQAWEAKDFLLEQDGLASITLEGQTHENKKSRQSTKSEL